MNDRQRKKKCKHHWEPWVEEMAEGWSIKPRCKTCHLFGSPEDERLSRLILQMVSIRVRVG
jgi:hypothetical protein